MYTDIMAIVSESMLYQERIAPSYVSSSGYYGYVPPTCPFANYESVVVKEPRDSANEAINEATVCAAATTDDNYWTITKSTTLSCHQNHNDDHDNDDDATRMETDEDESLRNDEFHVGVSRCQNNRCVIPEVGVAADVGTSSRPNGGSYEEFYRLIADTEVNDITKRRGNRKRNCAGDPACLIDDRSANFTKKSRQGGDGRDLRQGIAVLGPTSGRDFNQYSVSHRDGGNGNIRNGTRHSREFGSSALYNEQTSLINGVASVIANGTDRLCDKGSKSFRCHEKAGNYDSSGRTDLEDSCTLARTSGIHKFGDSYLDYEIMLMETHGCSAYHYNPYRHSDSPASAETEF